MKQGKSTFTGKSSNNILYYGVREILENCLISKEKPGIFRLKC